MIVVQLRDNRRKRRWPWILFILFNIIFILPVAVLYYFIYDDTTKAVKKQEGFSFQSWGNRILVDCMDHTVDQHKIALAVTENDMDNVLGLALEQAATINRFAKKAYMQISGDKYFFFVDLDLSIVKTRVKISTVLTDDKENDRFIFSVKDISLGKIEGLKNLGKNFLGKYLSEDAINSFIKQVGLSVNYVSAESAMYYNKTDIVNDMSKMSGDSEAGMFLDIMKTMMDQKLFTFETTTGNFLEAQVNLEKLATNDLVTDDEDHIVLTPDKVGTYCRDKIVTLVNEEALQPETANLDKVFKFLFHGYSGLTDEEKTYIDEIDMSSIEITDKDDYKGFNLTSGNDDLINKMKATMDIPALIDKVNPTKDVCSLSEKDVNDFIKGRNILGYTTLMHRQAEETYKVNFVTIDNFYCNIYDKHSATPTELDKTAEFVCKLNVNGYHTSLTFDCHVHDTVEDNKITFYVDDVRFGEMDANELKEQFFGIIEEALKGTADNSLTADKTNYSFSFDFNYILSQAENEVTTAVDATFPPGTPEVIIEQAHQTIHTAFTESNAHIDVTGNARSDNGGIKISLPKTIWEYTPSPIKR